MNKTVIAVSLVAVVGFGAIGRSQTSSPSSHESPIAGAWRITEGPRGAQDSLWLFTDRYFTRIGVQGDGQRTPFTNPGDPSIEERASAYDSFNANAGVYQIAGSTITFHILMAKSQGIVGQELEQEFELNGSTLTVKNANGATFRLTRLE